jgi:predicted TPR repeat methyltransferase
LVAVEEQQDPALDVLEYVRAGRVREGIDLCHARLAERPDDVQAVRVLARLLLEAGQAAVAGLLLDQALKANPSHGALRAELGTTLASVGRREAAVEAFERALLDDPSNADAHFGLTEMGATEELTRALRAAVSANPSDPVAHFALANALLAADDDSTARDSFRRAVELEPAMAQRHVTAGARLAMVGRHDEARRMYAWGLTLNPVDPQLRHMARALDGGMGPERAADDYVAALFDAFADGFDETLLGRLEYRAPELVVDAVRGRLPGSAERTLAVLDAGCGTGLCGPLLRPLASRLVGIDLSEQMLERATATGAYDELRLGEIARAMTAEPAAYDVIVAADVLPYFGTLDDLFAAAATALRPNGLMGVTVERSDDEGHELRSSGRYAHSADYLRQAAAEAGLLCLDLHECSLRLEAGKSVEGYVAALGVA